MIQQLISTSSPRCLNGNAGFGIVAQTTGMAPNVSQAVNMLSGYYHHFAAGDVRNPAAFLHTLRRTGGVRRHIVSRTADAGNDYSGRTNRLAHHWIIEENDVGQLPCGPAALAAQNIFTTVWNGQSRELPQQNLNNVPVLPQKSLIWEQLTGDAGWAGVVAERIEKGSQVSIIFTVNQGSASEDVRLRLLNEVFALLPEQVRWQTTFSTFFMKSQEPAGSGREERIQVKFFLEGTDEARYAKQSPETLLIDLRNPAAAGTCPAGKYIDAARGIIKYEPISARSNQAAASPVQPDLLIPAAIDSSVYEIDGTNLTLGVTKISRGLTSAERAKIRKSKRENINPLYWIVPVVLLLIVLIGTTVYLFTGKSAVEIAKADREQKQAAELAEKEQKAKAEAEQDKKAEAKAEQDKKAEEEAKKKAEEEKKKQEEDEKKAAEAKAEQDKKAEEEAKKKAEEEKKKQEEDEKKKLPEKITAAFNGIPNVWEDLALPLNKAKPLDLKILLDIQGVQLSEITLDYVPFLDLEKTKNHKIITKPDKQKQCIMFVFGGEMQTNLETGKEANVPDKPIAECKIEKENIVFTWKKDADDTDGRRVLNRILLGKLKIMVQGQSKEISLWTPMVWDSSKDSENHDFLVKDKSFPLWYKKDKNNASDCQFVGYGKEDNPAFFLDFDAFSVKEDEKDTLKKVEPKELQQFPKDGIITYAPKIKLTDAAKDNIWSQLEFKEDLDCTISIVNQEIKNKTDEKNLEDGKKDAAVKYKQKVSKERKEKEQSLSTEIKKLEQKQGKNQKEQTNLLNKKSELEYLKNTKPKDDPKSADKWKDADKQQKDAEAASKKLTDDINKLKQQLEKIKIPEFKIYLLKSGTKLEDAAKPENQLLLLEVK